MSAHTPGPWAVIEGAVYAGEGAVAQTATGWDAPTAEANLDLIAAAPEMLDALKAIAPYMPTTTAAEGGASAYSENVRAADMVRAAIAKAEGRS